MLKHKVCIGVGSNDRHVITSSNRSLPGKLLKLLFGENTGVFILTPGKSVEAVEIRELPAQGGESV
jgi:hypothetical protein